MDITTKLKNLKILNDGKKIKLRYNKNRTGSYSLFLDFSNGSREKEYLKIVLQGTKESYALDKEKFNTALLMREHRELEYMQNITGFKLKSNDVDFITYFEELSKKKHDSYRLSLMHFKNFYKKDTLLFDKINRNLCQNFADHLIGSDIASSTANLYFKKFGAVLNDAVKNEIIMKNPAKGINIKYSHSKREFLTEEELKILLNTPMQVEDTKNAFLFACFTGLRLSDLRQLKKSDIKEGYLHIKQQKTEDEMRIKLSEVALNIIKKQTKNGDLVFNLKPKNVVAGIMTRWIKRSGIEKKITFHCSRHTFATMLLTKGADIYAVSKLIGHKDLKTTQIYAKLVDKRKDEAIDLLPKL